MKIANNRNPMIPYVAPLCLAALLSSPATAASLLRYTDGHADFGVSYASGLLDFHFHAEGATVDGLERDDEEFHISDIVVIASGASMVTLPVAFAPLGASSGDTVWVLPESQNLALPFFGLATEELVVSEWTGMTFSLVSVTAPSPGGNFALWQSGSFGATLLHMSTVDPGPDQVLVTPGSHAHYNWGFTAPGDWAIEIAVSGTHAVDGFKTTTETINFHVVPEPSGVLLGGLGVMAFALRRRK